MKKTISILVFSVLTSGLVFTTGCEFGNIVVETAKSENMTAAEDETLFDAGVVASETLENTGDDICVGDEIQSSDEVLADSQKNNSSEGAVRSTSPSAVETEKNNASETTKAKETSTTTETTRTPETTTEAETKRTGHEQRVTYYHNALICNKCGADLTFIDIIEHMEVNGCKCGYHGGKWIDDRYMTWTDDPNDECDLWINTRA